MKLKIPFHETTLSRGFLLVLVVLVPQIALLFIGFSIGKNQDQLLQKAKNAFFFSAQINATATAQIIACGYQTLYVLIGAEKDGQQANYYKKLAVDSLEKIRRDPERDWKKAAIYADFEQQAEERFRQFFELKSINEISDALNARGQLKAFRKFANMTLNRDVMFQKGMAEQVSAITKAIDEIIQFKTFLNYLIVVGLFANLGIAIYLSQTFSRSIAGKLEKLMVNAALLAQKKEPVTKVEGINELAHLDKVFHRVWQELVAQEEFKNNLLSMVAHDMCSPLAAVSLSLSIVELAEGDKLSGQSKEALGRASADVDILVSQAREVLDVQRLAAGDTNLDEEPGASSEKLRELSKLVRVEHSMLLASHQRIKPLKPTLAAKTYVLFLTPILVSMIFLGLILIANIDAMKTFETEKLQSAAALDINKVIASDFISSAFLVKHLMDGNAKDLTQYFKIHEIETTATTALHIYSFEGEANARFQNAVRDLTSAQTKEFALAKRATPGLFNEGQIPDLRAVRSLTGALRCMVKKQSSLIDMTEAQLAAYQNLSATDEQRKQQTSNLIIWGIIADLSVALVAAFAYSFDITRRLEVVKENADRLSNRGPLKQLLTGNDEICYLDSIIHQSSETLERALRQRILLMETVAEELRRPLIKIAADLDIVATHCVDEFTEKSVKHFSSATNNVNRILVLIDTLIAAENLNSQQLAIEKKTFLIAGAISKAIESVGALAASRQIELHSDASDITVDADFNRIVQVLVNYLTNAINHTPEGGSICLRGRLQSHETASVPVAVISVEDTGPGLSAESREKVFERFYQTADSMTKKKGYGMGLAICKLIAEAHEGKVGVDESPAGGCAFYIELPGK